MARALSHYFFVLLLCHLVLAEMKRLCQSHLMSFVAFTHRERASLYRHETHADAVHNRITILRLVLRDGLRFNRRSIRRFRRIGASGFTACSSGAVSELPHPTTATSNRANSICLIATAFPDRSHRSSHSRSLHHLHITPKPCRVRRQRLRHRSEWRDRHFRCWRSALRYIVTCVNRM
jgi:hypothetical protein